MKKFIDEDRLFRHLNSFFDNPSVAVSELAQNAQRARATRLEITLQDGVLTVEDNGNGASNIAPIFVLSESDWSPRVTRDQMPAGWGLFAIFCISEEVRITSLFGSITVDCKRFLHEYSYRASIRTLQTKAPALENGFSIAARLRPSVLPRIEFGSLCHFGMEVLVNGSPVTKKRPQDWLACNTDDVLAVQFEGNTVYVNPWTSLGKLECSTIGAIWYGSMVNLILHRTVAVIDVSSGSPVTPVLPFRAQLIDDDKMVRLLSCIREALIGYWTETINSFSCDDPITTEGQSGLLECMMRMEDADQEELDRLDWFYIKSTDVGNASRYDHIIDHHFVRRGADVPFTPETFHISIPGVVKGMVTVPDVIVEEGIFVAHSFPSHCPSWLQAEEQRDVAVTVSVLDHTGESTTSTEFDWYRAEFSDPRISVMACRIKGAIHVFYRDEPDSVYDLSYVVYSRFHFNESEGSWDAEHDRFNEALEEDVEIVSKTISPERLLAPLRPFLGEMTQKVAAIEFVDGRKTLVLTFTDGSTQKLKAA